MTYRESDLPDTFKGIALFTPGGDLIYGIDPSKQARWHIHLCLGLQGIWGLSDPPHFLVPGYTATVERWRDTQTQELKVIAEVYPAIERYIPLLKVLFNLKGMVEWKTVPWQEEYCNRALLETYKQQFPQLWEEQDLIIRLDPKSSIQKSSTDPEESISVDDFGANDEGVAAGSLFSDTSSYIDETGGYILRLFISSNNLSAEQTLGSIHQILEQGLNRPYTLKVIDINKNPEQAEIYQVSATPTLVRVAPKPMRRIVGQLDDIQRVLRIISSS